jgi:quinol monooxygenase YgiN
MTVEWLVPDGQARSVTMALQAFSADTRTMRGCQGCSVATSSANGVTVRYTEDWQSEEPLRDHVRSDLFGKLISLIEASIRPPRIEFDLPGGKRGLDYIAEARRAPE